nr:hypothetical protein [uncultured Acetatifactor sp.]
MLEQIFLKVLDMSRAASMIIVVVFFVRILLKRFHKYISYLLWSVVLFRLSNGHIQAQDLFAGEFAPGRAGIYYSA